MGDQTSGGLGEPLFGSKGAPAGAEPGGGVIIGSCRTSTFALGGGMTIGSCRTSGGGPSGVGAAADVVVGGGLADGGRGA